MSDNILLLLSVGRPAPLTHNHKTVPSAFVKLPVESAVRLTLNGLVGDEQADLENHGGPDKAVCVYSQDHYSFWAERIGNPLPNAAFGENFGVSGMTEGQVCIGDVYTVGDDGCRVEVSQPRQPCFKLGMRNHLPALPSWAIETGKTGFYFRCLTEGNAAPGAPIRLEKRPFPNLTITEGNRLLYRDRDDFAGLKRYLAAPALSASWRRILGRYLTEEN